MLSTGSPFKAIRGHFEDVSLDLMVSVGKNIFRNTISRRE